MKIAIKKHDEYDFRNKPALNDWLWDDNALKDDIREILLKISKEFLKFLNVGVTDEDIEDIQFTGSLANYNYTKHSDFDLHILFDFNKIDENHELVKEFLMSKKNIWNNNYPIKIKGYQVEIYPQSVEEIHHSTGVYSVLNNEWVAEPEKPTHIWSRVNISDIKKKVEELEHEIDNIENVEDKLATIGRVKDKIKKMRQAGLARAGEYSAENLAFKVLRRTDYLHKLYKLGREEYAKLLSLNGVEEREITEEELYEDIIGILKEDVEWWKKRRKIDKKNFRILVGHVPGAKGSHAKKGAPFTSDPKKYPGTKGQPGLGLLEAIKGFTINTFNELPVGSAAAVTAQEGFFAIGIKPGDKFTVTRAAEDSFIFDPPIAGKTRGTSGDLQKAINMLNIKPSSFDVDVPEEKAEPAKEKAKKEMGDVPISDRKQKKVAKGVIKKYIPNAPEKTVDKVGDWFSENPFIKTVQELLGSLWEFIKSILGGLGLGGALGVAADVAKGGRGLGSGAGKFAVMFGDSQMGGGLGRALQEKIEAAGYEVCKGCKQHINGASVRALTNSINIKYVLEQKKPALVAITAGGNGATGAAALISKVKEWHPEGDKVKIYWFGPPPSVVSAKGSRKFVDSKVRGFDARKRLNQQIDKDVSGIPNVTFINPYEYVTDFYKKGGDGLHMPHDMAKRFIDKAFSAATATAVAVAGDEKILSDKESVVNQIKRNLSATQRSVASVIEREFKAAGLPASIAAAAIVNSHTESGLDPYIIGDGGNSVGLFQIHRGSDKRPFWVQAGLDPKVTKETKLQFRKRCKEQGLGSGGYRCSKKFKNKEDFARERLAAGDFRFDPARNAQTIINYEVKRGAGRKLRSRAAAAAAISELAAIFSRDIERPADKAGNMRKRAAKAKKWFV